MENRCVVCNTVIPEGRQVCPRCMSQTESDTKTRMLAYLNHLREDEMTKAANWRNASQQMGWSHTNAPHFAHEHEEHAAWIKMCIEMVEERL